MSSTFQQLSKDISEIVNQAGRSVVAVDGRSGHTSSGIVWLRDAVLTAAHSVKQESNIRVIFATGRAVQARLAGRDRGTDLAVLKLNEEIEMEPVRFANTTSLSVGELSVAVARTRRGNIVASAGMISGLMGEWQIGRTRIDQFIRPDLNLYPGFSGGALVDATGAVLGMNTSGLLRGKPLTIPSSTLARVAEEIASTGHAAKPYIGLVMQAVQVPESLQKKAGVTVSAGLLVMHVEPGGPADTAGVLIGDLLLDMDGTAFGDLDDTSEVLGRKGTGQDVDTALIRGGQRLQLKVRIGSRPSH